MVLFAHDLVELYFLEEERAKLLAVEVLFFEFDLDFLICKNFLLNLLYFLEEGMIKGFVN